MVSVEVQVQALLTEALYDAECGAVTQAIEQRCAMMQTWSCSPVAPSSPALTRPAPSPLAAVSAALSLSSGPRHAATLSPGQGRHHVE